MRNPVDMKRGWKKDVIEIRIDGAGLMAPERTATKFWERNLGSKNGNSARSSVIGRSRDFERNPRNFICRSIYR
jgi:hypothetical protein